jgi:hypothetical protein
MIERSWRKNSFERVAQRVLDTAPLRQRGNSPLLLSMTCHSDIMTYLLAIKSLYLRIGQGRVLVISDGSLTADDTATLHYHIPELQVLEIGAIQTGACPRGGTWERLIKIIELSDENYIIQLDADTLASAPIQEVVQCWQTNTSFLLGTGSGQIISPAPYTARMVRNWIKTNGWTELTGPTVAEASLDQLPNASQKYYVHASSGFAGFARGAFRMANLECFSTFMTGLLGEQRWNEWGSEQIASNYLLANAPQVIVLPYPRFACFEPHLQQGEHAFLHFIGAHRYNGGVYRRWAADFITHYKRANQFN